MPPPPPDVGRSNGTAKLESAAAAAALKATAAQRPQKTGHEFLDRDNKLSSAGAAASLKYARPQDLPSFPSAGLKNSAASQAASAGWSADSNEPWKPVKSEAAQAAAFLAKDYKMAPLWKPEDSSNGARAALIAHRDGVKLDLWQFQPSAWGYSAASIAMKSDRAAAPSPEPHYKHTAIGRQGSMLAATGAMATSRKRAESTPTPTIQPNRYPDESNAVSNALSAATSASIASKNKQKSPPVGGAVPWTTMSREMYTATPPPMGQELEAQNHEDELHEQAVTMAKKLYSNQQMRNSAAIAASGRRSSVSSDEFVQPMRFNNLQEAAQKLAQQRLSKLHDEHAQNKEYRDYYQAPVQAPPSRGRTRNRSSSFGHIDDREQANKIRAQASIFSSNVSQIDAKKRQADREALLAAAQRNVTKRLSTMDQQVFENTGKVGPGLLNEWELKAHAAAQAKSNARMENYGKINIGGGKFMDQNEVDAVAAKRVQPVLDEINEKAETERIRRLDMKVKEDEEKRVAEEKKAHDKELKGISKKLKQQDKTDEKSRKDEEKARKAEEKRLVKEKRKSTVSEPKAETAEVSGGNGTTESSVIPAASEPVDAPVISASESPIEHAAPTAVVEATPVAVVPSQASQPVLETAPVDSLEPSTSPQSGEPKGSKAKNWLKSKLRRTSKSQKGSETSNSEKGFIGGVALTGASDNSIGSQSNAVKARETPVLSGTTNETEPTVERGRTPRRASTISAVSSLGASDEEFQEARDNFDSELAPPPSFAAKPSSPVRDSKFREEIV